MSVSRDVKPPATLPRAAAVPQRSRDRDGRRENRYAIVCK